MTMTLENNYAFQKIKHLILSRYGKQIKMHPLAPLSLNSEDAFPKKEYIKDNNLYIQLNSRHQYLGTLQVQKIDDIKDEDLTSITNLVRLSLEPFLYISYLERKEKNLRIEKELGWDTPDKTTPIHSKYEEIELTEFRPQRRILFLRSQNQDSLLKTAFKVHEKIGSWAYAPLNDVKKSLFQASDLEKLNGMTIFVPSFQSLSAQDISMIIDYVENKSMKQGPFFVIGVKDALEMGLTLSKQVIFDDTNQEMSSEEREELLEYYLN